MKCSEHSIKTTWLIPCGIPHNVLSDNGGKFDREFSDLVESLGSTILRSASYAPTQNGTTERRGGAWKAHDSIRFETQAVAEHLCAAVNWAVNQDIDESGYSPAQWVLGRGLRLPYSMLATHGQLAAQTRLGQDPDFTRRVGMLAAAKRSVASLRYSRGLSKAFSARSRSEASVPAKWTYNVGDQVFYWRGSTKNKAQWMHRWLGPGVIIGVEANNLWISHRGAVVKAASRHVRPAEPEELVPWEAIYEMAEQDAATAPLVPERYLDLGEPHLAAPAPAPGLQQQGVQQEEEPLDLAMPGAPQQEEEPTAVLPLDIEIGRASCRERVFVGV